MRSSVALLAIGVLALVGEADAQSATKTRAVLIEPVKEVATVDTRPGATVRFAAERSPRPALTTSPVAVILLAGGNGKLNIGANGTIASLEANFLIRTRRSFLSGAVGYVAAVDVPSNYPTGLDGRARLSPEHAADLGVVIAEVKRRTSSPVWLVATSNGTLSAVNAAIALRGTANAPAGIVLTSSRASQVANVCGISVFDAPLAQINVPVLVIGNPGDRCQCTAYPNQQSIVTWLTAAPRKEFKAFTAPKTGLPPYILLALKQSQRADPCSALTPHGFLGVEQPVVSYILNWIAPSPRPVFQQVK